MFNEYDIIVVGAGHAGCEAASAAANLGSKVMLITLDMSKISQMSCNPAMGGIAKGQIIREIDALGGYSGIVTDKSMIQFRMLNKSKGPALWSPRAQCDRSKFSMEWRKIIESNENIDILQDSVVDLIIEKNKVRGVITKSEIIVKGSCVILTTGTFENGLMHIGKVKIAGGRIAEPFSTGISKRLELLGFEIGRLKTGTPARIDGRTVNFNKMIRQNGDRRIYYFSFMTKNKELDSLPCYITYTNKKTHEILEGALNESPLPDHNTHQPG